MSRSGSKRLDLLLPRVGEMKRLAQMLEMRPDLGRSEGGDGPAWRQKKGEAEAVPSPGFWFRSLHQTIFTFSVWKLWPPGTCNYLMRNCVSILQLPGAQIRVLPTCPEPGLLGIMVCPICLQPGTEGGSLSTPALIGPSR